MSPRGKRRKPDSQSECQISDAATGIFPKRLNGLYLFHRDGPCIAATKAGIALGCRSRCQGPEQAVTAGSHVESSQPLELASCPISTAFASMSDSSLTHTPPQSEVPAHLGNLQTARTDRHRHRGRRSTAPRAPTSPNRSPSSCCTPTFAHDENIVEPLPARDRRSWSGSTIRTSSATTAAG